MQQHDRAASWSLVVGHSSWSLVIRLGRLSFVLVVSRCDPSRPSFVNCSRWPLESLLTGFVGRESIAILVPCDLHAAGVESAASFPYRSEHTDRKDHHTPHC